MGVPAFYRWLVERYPLIVADVVEEKPVFVDGVKIPVDVTKPNPNNLEYDNLYLDVNGIIYLCLHPEDSYSPISSDELFLSIFNYIDRLFGMVRPRKLLYMAVDGVAPRAKMNEQRCRRFRAAKDAADAAAEEEKLRRGFEREGRKLLRKQESQINYSQAIAPGTEFMAALSVALKYYIHFKLNYDTGWKGVKVILSDANVPGEGEHKIMSYIRHQRNLPGYDPNTRHCVYGLDADLIMLALATHEVHFSILRKVVFTPGQQDKCCHLATDFKGKGKSKAGEHQFLHVWRLREYLEYELRIPNLLVEVDFERVVDDFVFMCFFLGNDFLPRMPTLEIWEGALNLLLAVYKKEFVALGDYLIDSSKPNLGSAEHFIRAVGSYEDDIFQKRALLNKRQAEKFKRERAQIRRGDVSQPQVQPESLIPVARFQGSHLASGPSHENFGNKNELKRKLKELLREKSDTFSSDNPEEDKVKLGEPGWKQRYYEEKFSARTPEELDTVRKDVVAKYIEGLCWVTHYYYEGVCSWQWFYPYHYAPFASDLKDFGQLNVSFELGSPFKPFTQMLGVSPAASSHALPKQYRKLMTDPTSPIIDFYPTDFKVDTNGKRYYWQGIAKLPFVDEARLLAEVAKIEPTLTHEEVQRNSSASDMLFASSAHPLSRYILSLDDKEQGNEETLDPGASMGMNGYISFPAGDPCPPIFRSPIRGMEDIRDNRVTCVIYRLPDAHKHVTRPPMGVILPERTVMMGDVKPDQKLWHEDSGTRPENGRQSLKQIAADRLPVTSLQMKIYNQPAAYRNNSNEHGYGTTAYQRDSGRYRSYQPNGWASYINQDVHRRYDYPASAYHWNVLPRFDVRGHILLK